MKDGHDVVIFASDMMFDKNFHFTKRPAAEYVNAHNIRVKILERTAYSKLWFLKSDFNGLYGYIEKEAPDIIFVHGPQFVSLKDIKKYKKQHPAVKIFIDNHADYYNTRVKKLRKKIAHWFFYGHTMRSMSKDVEMFWGVTPWRCDFLHKMYGVPKEKIGLLVMGGDDEKINFENLENIKKSIRQKYDIADGDFLIITGGKIDKTKNIHLLVDAVKAIGSESVKLLVFGQPTREFEEEFLTHVNNSGCIRYIGWIDSDSVYDYFLASDLCVFPGTHSVLWEQACACGLPGIYKYWEGMHHVDLDGSALFLHNDTVDEIKAVLTDILNDPEKYETMKKAAERGKVVFSYREISKRAINGEK
jgi:glycosyltransferase involved in cell wall biosynthesis